MKELDRPIGRVWRRLRFQRFLTAAVWSLAAGLAVATIVLGVEKLGRLPIPGAAWLPFAISGGLSIVVAALIAALTGPDRTEAAVALDRAFGLNERLSTALTLPPELRETPAGRALVLDAVKHVSDLDVLDRFGLSVPRRAWLPIVPGLIAAAIVFVPEWANTSNASGKTATGPVEEKKLVSKETSTLGKKMSEQRQQMDKQKFAEADKLLAQVEKAANDMAKSPPAEKEKALMALNKLTDALKERQKQLGSPEQVNRQLQQLKDMASQGPADDFAKALAKGDFDKAMKEMKQLKEKLAGGLSDKEKETLKQLKEKLAAGTMSDKEKEALKKLEQKLAAGTMSDKEKEALKQQVKEMAQQLQKLANLEERKKQLEEAQKNGGLSKEQFEKEMAKLNDQAKNLEKLQKMAQQLGKAEQEMAKGDMKKAAEALGMTEQQLQQMAQDLQELKGLDSAMASLQEAKEGMNGGDQEGMNQLGEGMNSLGQSMRRNQGDGMGMNRGIGDGARPEAPDSVNTYKAKTTNQYGKGTAVVEGTAPPISQTKGQSQIMVQGEVDTNSGSAADALSNQKIPKSVEKHIRGYFDQINKNP